MPTRSDRTSPRRRVADDRGVHINFITWAEAEADGGICLQTRGSSAETRYRSLGSTPGARQATEALLSRLYIHGGTWTSSATLAYHHESARRFLRWLEISQCISDLSDARLTPALVWEGILASVTGGGLQRNLRTFLADALPLLREDGDVHREYLYGRALPVEKAQVQGYAPNVAAAIEKLAKERVGQWFRQHREAVREALGILPHNWLHCDATQLVPYGTKTCPLSFKVSRDDLAAAMVLLALIDDKGPNLSTIQSYTSDSTERVNGEAGFVTGIKARNREVLRTPAPAGGLYSYGGLLEFVAAATRVERLLRSDGTDFDRLLFVATGSMRVMGREEVNSWWQRNQLFWDYTEARYPATLSFQRLRKAALLRGRHQGHRLIGQKNATERLYLADALPDAILIPGLLNTQKDTADYWRSKNRAVVAGATDFAEPPQDAAEQIGPLVKAEAVMDVGVAACINNGQSPEDASKPCGLGPVACFVCPKGYRIPEIIPGLIATVQFTENIRKYEPNEWVTGEAPMLNSLARKALGQFPRQFVEAVPAAEIANSRALIACVYVEGRRRD